MEDWKSPENKESFLKRFDLSELEKVQFEQVSMDLHDLLRHVGSLIEGGRSINCARGIGKIRV